MLPGGRRIEPYDGDRPLGLFSTRSRRHPYKGPGFNDAENGPVGLWVNRESRHEVLKHYIAREPAHLEYLKKRDMVRYAAHIDFAKDTISFCGRSLQTPDRFLLKIEMEKVAHLELTITFGGPIKDSITETLNKWIPLFPNVEDIFLHAQAGVIDGDEWLWYDLPPETGSVSAELKEAREVGEAILKGFERQSQEEGRSWKMPLLVIEPATQPTSFSRPIEEVRRLVEEFRSAAKKSLLPEQ